MEKNMASFKSADDHPRYIGDLYPRFEHICTEYDLGTLDPMSIGRNGKSQIVVYCYCSECGISYEIGYYNITGRKTTNCRCQRRLKYASFAERVAGIRYDAMKQRCENKNDPNYKNYGGRGIQNNFQSREQYISYIIDELGFEGQEYLDIDRIDNDGHYEPGNLRLATRSENNNNRRPRSSLITRRRRRKPPSRKL